MPYPLRRATEAALVEAKLEAMQRVPPLAHNILAFDTPARAHQAPQSSTRVMASPLTERRPARVTAVAAAGLREKVSSAASLVGQSKQKTS